MANKHKGEISFEADGKTYTLRLSANAICNMEEILNLGIIEIFEELQSWKDDKKKIRLSFIRSVFRAALSEKHPEITDQDAGNLMNAAGGLLGTSSLIMQAVEASNPQGVETKGARPRNRGTGKS